MWAYALCEIGGDYATTVGNSIDDMFDRISSANNTLYFHNLKFDGEFIIYWLFRVFHNLLKQKFRPGTLFWGKHGGICYRKDTV